MKNRLEDNIPPISPPIEEKSNNFIKIPYSVFFILAFIIMIMIAVGIFYLGMLYQINKTRIPEPIPTITLEPTQIPTIIPTEVVPTATESPTIIITPNEEPSPV